MVPPSLLIPKANVVLNVAFNTLSSKKHCVLCGEYVNFTVNS